MTVVLYPNEMAPKLTFTLLSGDTYTLSDRHPTNFTIVIFYRGAFCPLCMNYIKEIEENYSSAYDTGLEIVVVSMDTQEKAETSTKDIATMVPIGYGLTEEVARSWGLYMSSGRPDTTEPSVFSEPGLFVIRPDNTIFMAMVQSAPFTRPSIPQLLNGLGYAIANHYPARGNITNVD
jgi:peroxiredoxin